MNKKKIKLQVLNISASMEREGAYAMLLGEINGSRQMPVIIGAAEAQAIMIDMKGLIPPRPMTHTLFATILQTLGVNLLRALIYKEDNGVFYSYLYLKMGETILRIDARTSDAVILSMRMNAPLMIYDELLEAEYQKLKHGIDTNKEREEKEKEEDTAPTETLEQLEASLQNAIEKEDYERAALLRDAINQYTKS